MGRRKRGKFRRKIRMGNETGRQCVGSGETLIKFQIATWYDNLRQVFQTLRLGLPIFENESFHVEAHVEKMKRGVQSTVSCGVFYSLGVEV